MLTAQEVAAEVLVIVEEEVVSAKEAIKKVIGWLSRRHPELLDFRVRGSVHAYVMETLKRMNTIDFLADLCLRGKRMKELNPLLRNLIRIGLYEMLYHDVHPALATDSAVRIAKKRLGKGAASLVNAIMRRAEKIDLEREIKKLNLTKRVALKYHHPEWYVRFAFRLLGRDEAIKLMLANMKSTTYVRVNELRASVESVRGYLEKFCDVKETPLPYVFRVENWEKHPSALEWHEKGKYVVQDLASALSAHLLSPEPGDFVVDLAAAPGIKTSQLAMLMENRGRIVAVDNSPERLERMRAKMKQLGVKIVDCVLGDGATFRTSKRADCVLLDPPCSSTGALRNYPCVKWRFDEKKYISTIWLQKKMLKNALSLGERVLYSTCSITFDENEGNLSDFEDYVSRVKVRNIRGFEGWRGCGIREFEGRRFGKWKEVVRLWPHVHDCCGFFISLLRGTAEVDMRSRQSEKASRKTRKS